MLNQSLPEAIITREPLIQNIGKNHLLHAFEALYPNVDTKYEDNVVKQSSLSEDFDQNEPKPLKKQACSPTAPYQKIGGDCVAVRDCGELQVWNVTEFEFSCKPCAVFVTGYNSDG